MKTREIGVFSIKHVKWFREQTLIWVQQFDHIHFFNNNNYSYPFGAFVNRIAAGCAAMCPIIPGQTFENLQQFHTQYPDWLIGYLSYDLKNEIEDLYSHHTDELQFPPAYFYIPQHVIHVENDHIVIESLDNPEVIYKQIAQIVPSVSPPEKHTPLLIKQRTSREMYIQHVNQLKNHILEGDMYELNYCIEFFAQYAPIHAWQVYQELNLKSPMPFSVFARMKDLYVMCASPERFLKKTGNILLSQPIKGTARRGKNAHEDALLKEGLRTNEKELAENMMIVDLVRNDLAKSATTGTVRVEEMFGVYTFPQLHQMISSVSAQLRPDISFAQAIKNAFPMGSMTGAPKIKVMELIEQCEQARRGIYSGALGYITPQGDFDFNVVIRSIIYNAANHYLSFQVGSAITYDANAEQEYEECLLKAKAIQEVLAATHD